MRSSPFRQGRVAETATAADNSRTRDKHHLSEHRVPLAKAPRPESSKASLRPRYRVRTRFQAKRKSRTGARIVRLTRTGVDEGHGRRPVSHTGPDGRAAVVPGGPLDAGERPGRRRFPTGDRQNPPAPLFTTPQARPWPDRLRGDRWRPSVQSEIPGKMLPGKPTCGGSGALPLGRNRRVRNRPHRPHQAHQRVLVVGR